MKDYESSQIGQQIDRKAQMLLQSQFPLSSFPSSHLSVELCAFDWGQEGGISFQPAASPLPLFFHFFFPCFIPFHIPTFSLCLKPFRLHSFPSHPQPITQYWRRKRRWTNWHGPRQNLQKPSRNPSIHRFHFASDSRNLKQPNVGFKEWRE